MKAIVKNITIIPGWDGYDITVMLKQYMTSGGWHGATHKFHLLESPKYEIGDEIDV